MRAFAPLREPIFARLWSSLAIFTMGDELYRVALVWLAVELVGRQAGYLGALQSSCMMLGAIFGGRLADAINQRRAMSILLATGALAVLIPPIAWDLGYASFWALLVPAVWIALMRAQLEPGVQSSVPILVPDRDTLFAANGLIDGVRRMARITGPMLAAALALAMPVHELFYFYALALLIAAFMLLRVGAMLPAREGRGDGGFLVGFRLVRADKTLRRILTLKCCTDGLWVVVIGFGLPLIVEQRGATWAGLSGVGAYGTGLAAYGIANILSSILVGSLKPSIEPGRMFVGNVLMGVGLACVGAGAVFASDALLLPAMYAGLALAALGPPFFDVPLALHIQLAGGPSAPRAAVASVHRVRIVSAFAGIVVAGALSPTLFGVLGTGPTMAAAGVACAAASLAMRWRVLRG
jgi:hypothetical protein